MNKKLLVNIIFILSTVFSYFVLDFYLRSLTYTSIDFVDAFYLPAFIFNLSIILIIIMFIYLFPKRSKLIYVTTIIFSYIYVLAQLLHFTILDRFFTVTDILLADQAAAYTDYIIEQFDLKMILMLIVTILFININSKLLKYISYIKISKRKRIYLVTITLLISILFSNLGQLSLGKNVDENAWNSFNTPRNIYNEYSNPSRNLMVSGTYKYILRDIYLYIKGLFINRNELIEDVDNYINSVPYQLEDNEYTNIFKDKNLIMIMMESVDSWLVNEEDMPALVGLQKTGLNFTNRYSPAYGGGMTINSEFASVNGIYAIVKNKPIFEYNNTYPYSLAHLFSNSDYIVNSVHMNTGSFYNRNKLHANIGFTHYPLSDIISDTNFKYDTNLIKNEESYNYIVNDNKFATLITTYSGHIPFVNNEICNSKINGNYTEMECIRVLARETDNFIKLLIERLKEDNLLDDTVIVLYTDHYLYGYSEVNEVKGIDNVNLLQNTPFVIWSNNMEAKEIDIINDTEDIMPTILNMFGITYNPKLYMGTDIFSNYHEKYVYFNDYSWFDGNIYYTGNNYQDTEYIRKISKSVNDKIKINSKIINSNYYEQVQ